jgi:hypothetical protein
MGRDSASSAQLKRAGAGEMVRLGPSLGELGEVGEWGVFMGADSIVGDAGGEQR